jgi:hypothetical protein
MVSRHKAQVIEMSTESRWLDEHAHELSAYIGQWVAVAGDAIVGADRDLSVLLKELERQGVQGGLIDFVGPEVQPDHYLIT